MERTRSSSNSDSDDMVISMTEEAGARAAGAHSPDGRL